MHLLSWRGYAQAQCEQCLLPQPLCVQVSFKEPTPPGVPLLLRSQVVSMKDSSSPSVGKASVEVRRALSTRCIFVAGRTTLHCDKWYHTRCTWLGLGFGPGHGS